MQLGEAVKEWLTSCPPPIMTGSDAKLSIRDSESDRQHLPPE
jgi:hypothetical protein